ncbi:ABC transporter ATP-binding protein [Leucobacter sp. cx-87]|nr:ABC transporter ATP-binding protein [Leucobacter sp. cx-87]
MSTADHRATGSESGNRLSVQHLDVTLGSGTHAIQILDNISFEVPAGTTVGLVGESGSGKSTIAKTIVGINKVSAGEILFNGRDISHAGRAERGELRRQIQMIPQDPYSSLDPRRTVQQTLAEALDPQRARVTPHRARILELLDMVSLGAASAERYPHEFSGGQRQRIAIARALAVRPQLIVADEITSALDLSTQAEVLELFEGLRRELGLTVLFVSHNLAVVKQVSDHVLVLLHGKIVEQGEANDVFTHPRHPYTTKLLDSVPGRPGFSID